MGGKGAAGMDEDREFDEFCVKHGFDPDRLDALTTCWLKYSMLDDLKNAEKAKAAEEHDPVT